MLRRPSLLEDGADVEAAPADKDDGIMLEVSDENPERGSPIDLRSAPTSVLTPVFDRTSAILGNKATLTADRNVLVKLGAIPSLQAPLPDGESVPHDAVGGIVAGDSRYCASGKFKSIHFVLTPFAMFRRFGICM